MAYPLDGGDPKGVWKPEYGADVRAAPTFATAADGDTLFVGGGSATNWWVQRVVSDGARGYEARHVAQVPPTPDVADMRQQASDKYLTAAVSRHRLAATGSIEGENLRLAIAAWHHRPPDEAATAAGFTAAHYLLRVCPSPPEVLAGLLHALDELTAVSRQRVAGLRTGEDRSK